MTIGKAKSTKADQWTKSMKGEVVSKNSIDSEERRREEESGYNTETEEVAAKKKEKNVKMAEMGKSD